MTLCLQMLLAVSKILEKAVYVQVNDYCKEHEIIYPLQSGFQKYYSTDTYLKYLLDHIRSEMSKGKIVGMLMLDVHTKGIYQC